MKTILKIAVTTIILLLITITDIPLLPVELVPDAQAILGVRRRTAVVAYSAGAAHSAAAASASQQQAAAAQQQAAVSEQQAEVAQQQAEVAQQQAAVAQQQSAAVQPSSVPIGTVVNALPAGCTAVTVGNAQYQDCGGIFYKAAFQGNNLVYVVVQKPL